MTLQDYRTSLILVPIESAYGTFYWSSIATLVLSCSVSEILQLLYAVGLLAEGHFFPYPNAIPAKISGCSLWSRPRSVMLGSAESEHPIDPSLTNSEIIFEEF